MFLHGIKQNILRSECVWRSKIINVFWPYEVLDNVLDFFFLNTASKQLQYYIWGTSVNKLCYNVPDTNWMTFSIVIFYF